MQSTPPMPTLGVVSDTLLVNSVYLSLQGESTFAGLPCVFVRLTGCNLRCSYCDTAYAFTEGRPWKSADLLAETLRLARPFARDAGATRLPLVELTGGEPLLQSGSVWFSQRLCDHGFTVLLETNGAVDIGVVDPRVRRIVDLKCPSSGEAERNRWENIDLLRPTDEVKFVIATHEDYDWAVSVTTQRRLALVCPVLFSWATPLEPRQSDSSLRPRPADHRSISRRELVEHILADALPVRFQSQLHKLIWPGAARDV